MDRPPLPPRNSTLSSSSSSSVDLVSDWAPPIPLSSKPQSWQGKPGSALAKPIIPSRANSEYMNDAPLPSPIPLSQSVSAPPAQELSSSPTAPLSPSSPPETSVQPQDQDRPSKKNPYRRVLVGAAKTVGRIYVGDEAVQAMERLYVDVSQRQWRPESQEQKEKGKKDVEAAGVDHEAHLDRKREKQQAKLQEWKEKQDAKRLQSQQQLDQREQKRLEREKLRLERQQHREQEQGQRQQQQQRQEEEQQEQEQQQQQQQQQRQQQQRQQQHEATCWSEVEADEVEEVDAAPPLPKRPQQQQPAKSKTHSPAIPPHLTRASSGLYYTASQPPSSIPADVANGYFVCYDCSGTEPPKFDSFWFRHMDVPRFSICSYCFEYHIRGTALESSFQGNLEPGGTPSARCMFSVPRMTELLWPLAKVTSDLLSVKSYMEYRVNIPFCHGLAGVTGTASEGLNWFQPKDRAIPGFIACAACYEEHVVGTDFEQCFVPRNDLQPPTDTWACDIAVPFVKNALAIYSSTNSWPAFVSAATRRLALPACIGMSVVKSSSRRWYGVTAGKPHLVICEQCYLDVVAFSAFEPDFQSSPIQQGEEDIDMVCDLAVFPIKISFALTSALGNRDCFWDTCRVQSNTAVCEKNDLINVQWHTLKDGCDNFNVCPTCYKGMICSAGLEDLFQPQKPTSEGVGKTCDFSSRAPRFSRYMLHYNTAMCTPDKETFTTFVRNISSVSLCHGVEFHKAPFYSVKLNDDPMYVCQSCYHEVIAGCALRDHFTLSDTIEEHMCEMYSQNMRTRWGAVCKSSTKDSNRQVLPSESALAEFMVYRGQRLNIYMQTVPIMQQIVNAAKLRLMRQQTLNVQSSFYLNMDGMANGINYAGRPAYRTTFGNSSLGYHWNTPWGVQGAQYGAQANAMMGSGGGDMVKVAYLERLWKEVE